MNGLASLLGMGMGCLATQAASSRESISLQQARGMQNQPYGGLTSQSLNALANSQGRLTATEMLHRQQAAIRNMQRMKNLVPDIWSDALLESLYRESQKQFEPFWHDFSTNV